MSADFVSRCRDGFVANLSSIAAVRALQNDGYLLASPTPPSVFVFPGGPAGDLEYDEANARGLDLWPWTIQVVVSVTGDRAAQMVLDEFLAPAGATSIKEAIESDSTLGGAVFDLIVRSCTGYRQFVYEGRPPALGAEWYVDVYATGRS